MWRTCRSPFSLSGRSVGIVVEARASARRVGPLSARDAIWTPDENLAAAAASV